MSLHILKGKTHWQGNNPSLTFQALSGDSGIANLDQSITINGQTVQPTFVYEGKNATTSAWAATVGSDLAIAGSGADPTPYQDTPFTDDADKGILFNAAKYFSAATGAWTTQDGVLSLVVKSSGTTNATILYHNDGSNGYRVYVDGSDQLVFEANGASSTVSVTSAALAINTWYFAELYFDKSGSAQWYVDGTASGSPADVSGTGSLAATTNLLVGSDGTNHFDNTIVLLGLWLQAGWLDTHLQTALAKERFVKLTGYYPELARGTAVPTTAARNSVAYLDKPVFGQVTKLFPVGANWLRVVKRHSASTTGIDLEDANGFAYSETLESNTFFLEQACAWTSGIGTFPRGGSYGQVVADATNTYHLIMIDLHPTIPSTHTFSAYVYPLTQPYFCIASYDINNDYAVAIFDATTGALVSTEGPVTRAACTTDPLAPGWFRPELSYSGGIAQHTHLVFAHNATSITAASYTGDGSTPDLYVYGIQHDYGTNTNGLLSASPYIRTSGLVRRLGEPVVGYLAEEAKTNLLTYSEQMDQSPWTLRTTGTAAVVLNATTAPDGTLTADRVTVYAIGTDDIFSYYLTGTPLAQISPSFWIKKITQTGLLSFSNSFAVTGAGYIDLSLLSNDWERITVTHPAYTLTDAGWFNSAASAAGPLFFPVVAGTTLEFYAWGFQFEEAPFPSSYIKTEASAATRVKDELVYSAGANVGLLGNPKELSINCDILTNASGTASAHIININDGGSANDSIFLTVEPTTGFSRARSTATAGSAGDVTGNDDVGLDRKHSIALYEKTNKLQLFDDSNLEGTDTAVTVPDELDNINIGEDGSAANQLNGVISNIRLYRGRKVL